MAVISAAVESNGWVLAVRGTWGSTVTGGAWFRSNGASINALDDRPDAEWRVAGINQFPLDPGGTPRLALNVQDVGFGRVGGLPVANANRPRTVVATRPLRLPYINSTSQPPLDETDHGDGTRTIRFALSDRIYAGSTIVSASFLSGWKVGQGGGTVNTVTNNSTRTAPPPLFKWANEPWPYVGGTAGSPSHIGRVEVLVATHHPEHDGANLHQACAAVRLRAFDGTTTKDFFFTAPQTSPLYADSLRCWGGDIDLSGLNPGPITVHATVFPWVGAERSTGTAHSTSTTAALGTNFDKPFHLWYDPTGAIWPRYYVDIDLVNGATTGSAVTLHTSLAAAQAASATTKARSISVAASAFRNGVNGNRTLPARNGFSSVTSCAAWWEMLLPEGVNQHSIDLTPASSHANSGPGYIVIRGTPASSDPRANCIIRSLSSATPRLGGMTRIKLRDLSAEIGEVSIFTTTDTNRWLTLENVDVRGKAGFANDGSNRIMFVGGANSEWFSGFNVTQRDCGLQDFGFISRNQTRTAMMASSSRVSTLINTRIVMPEAGEFAPSRGAAFNTGSQNMDDLMLWNVEVYGTTDNVLSVGTPAFGSTVSASFRWALINLLIECAGVPGSSRVMQIGETTGSVLRDSIFEGCTFIGGRLNFHNDVDFASSSSATSPVRVNGTATITIGLLNHGMATGDTINVSGFGNSAMNRTGVAVTVLDANRFTYLASSAVSSAPSGSPQIAFVTGAQAGQPNRFILNANLRQENNIIRYCAFDRNATKHDMYRGDPALTGSWEVLYGVGYRGNVNANRGVSTPRDFLPAYYGIASEMELNLGSATDLASSPAFAVNWFGYVDDRSNSGPTTPSAAYGGDYRADTAAVAPFKPSRLLNRATGVATTDRNARGQTRGLTFDSGALGRTAGEIAPGRLQAVAGLQPHRAADARVRWRTALVVEGARSLLTAGAAGLSAEVVGSSPPGRRLLVGSEDRNLVVGSE